MKWLSILDNLPFFVIIYNKARDKITYYNKQIKKTFNKTIKNREAFDDVFCQSIKIKRKRNNSLKEERVTLNNSQTPKKVNYSSIQDMVKTTMEEDKQSGKMQIEIKDWNKHCLYISDHISSEELLSIFIDNSQQKESEYKYLS